MNGVVVAGYRLSGAVVLGVLPAALVLVFTLTAAWPSPPHGTVRAVDLHTVWVGSGSYLHGKSPYPASLDRFVPSGSAQSFVQTPTVAALFAPVSLLPYAIVAALVPVALVAALLLSLWLLEVRDWRCFGAAFLSPAVLTSISIGTLTPLLVLGAASAWRWRHSRSLAALAVGATVALKLLAWPIVIWLWILGRRRAAARSAVIAVALLAAAFVPFGSTMALRYAALLRRDSEIIGPLSYGLVSLHPRDSGITLMVLQAVVVMIIGAAILYAPRVHVDERSAFAAAVLCSIALSPIIHLHYLALLVPTLAVLTPRFSWLWLLPCVLWLTPQQDSNGAIWRTTLVLGVLCVIAAVGGDGTASRDEAQQAGRLETSALSVDEL